MALKNQFFVENKNDDDDNNVWCIANIVQVFLNNSMKSWKLEMNASGKTLGEVDIRRGIFQVTPLLFVLCMVH